MPTSSSATTPAEIAVLGLQVVLDLQAVLGSREVLVGILMLGSNPGQPHSNRCRSGSGNDDALLTLHAPGGMRALCNGAHGRDWLDWSEKA